MIFGSGSRDFDRCSMDINSFSMIDGQSFDGPRASTIDGRHLACGDNLGFDLFSMEFYCFSIDFD